MMMNFESFDLAKVSAMFPSTPVAMFFEEDTDMEAELETSGMEVEVETATADSQK